MRVVITGCSSGIGKSICTGFVGEEVVCIDRTHGYDLSTIDELFRAIGDINVSPTDVLINNAGIMLFEGGLNNEQAQVMAQLNMMSVWSLLRQVNVVNGGNIINIASIAGVNHDEDTALYSATKAAVISLTKSYAKLYAPRRIRVNCISPGLFDTNLVAEPTPQWLIDRVPLKYEENPDNLVPVVRMILDTKYMTGANIVVDGGLSL